MAASRSGIEPMPRLCGRSRLRRPRVRVHRPVCRRRPAPGWFPCRSAARRSTRRRRPGSPGPTTTTACAPARTSRSRNRRLPARRPAAHRTPSRRPRTGPRASPAARRRSRRSYSTGCERKANPALAIAGSCEGRMDALRPGRLIHQIPAVQADGVRSGEPCVVPAQRFDELLLGPEHQPPHRRMRPVGADDQDPHAAAFRRLNVTSTPSSSWARLSMRVLNRYSAVSFVAWYSTSTRSPRRISSLDTSPLPLNASTGISARRLPSDLHPRDAPLDQRAGASAVDQPHALDHVRHPRRAGRPSARPAECLRRSRRPITR